MIDYIGGMLNSIGKMPKTHYKKLMVYNDILLETVMVSFGLLLVCLAGVIGVNRIALHR